VSFVTGGFLPATARGKVANGLLQHVDVPATFAALAGANIPSTEGFNVWDVLANGAETPRKEVPLNVDTSRVARPLVSPQKVIQAEMDPQIVELGVPSTL